MQPMVYDCQTPELPWNALAYLKNIKSPERKTISWDYFVHFRSSHRRCSVKKVFSKFTGEHLCRSLFFDKVLQGTHFTHFTRPVTLLKKRYWHRCFPVNFAKFLRTLFLYNTSGGCFWNVQSSPMILFSFLEIWCFLNTLRHFRVILAFDSHKP